MYPQPLARVELRVWPSNSKPPRPHSSAPLLIYPAAMESLVPQLPAHCVPQSQILIAISTLLQTCIPSWQSLISTLLGLVSITSWLFAQIPQIIKNSRRGSVEGLSWGFLMMWLLGDMCKSPRLLSVSSSDGQPSDAVPQAIY